VPTSPGTAFGETMSAFATGLVFVDTGGRTSGFNGSTWTPLATSPGSRNLAAATTNVGVGGTPVVFRGDSSPGVLHDLWSFNGSSWTQLFPASSPSPRTGAAMANDGFGGLFLSGGQDATSLALDDLWQFSGGSWTPIANHPPVKRALHTLILDVGRAQL